jgi:tRNA-Thr(GGU) m(6)t(6)A37 methyltransferase TsaA
MKQISDKLEVIGIIHSPYKTTDDVPRKCRKEISEIEIHKDYEQGLKDIEGFSHIHVFYWLHKSKGYSLMVNTPWDDTPHGLFTTRSPRRPNPIGYTTVELIEQNNNILRVKGLDAIDNTPVIDIKPYVKKMDAKNNAISGWIEKTDLKLD